MGSARQEVQMIRLPRKQVEAEGKQYATWDDFCRIFTKELDNLYGLLFLLTKDQAKAEKCFVAGLEDCVNADHVFKGWALSWARRALVQQAIREIQPHSDQQPPLSRQGAAGAINLVADHPERQVAIDGVLSLKTFERFVFVMFVLERYTEHECSLFLCCSPRDIRNARLRALQQIATLSSSSRVSHAINQASKNVDRNVAVVSSRDGKRAPLAGTREERHGAEPRG
jgi:hypothetical protein